MQVHLNDSDNWHDFEVESRREIIMLLRSISSKNQLVSMRIDASEEVVITSVLAVDAERGEVFLDRAPSQSQNRSLVAADRVSFETTLDKIRIMFSTSRVEACQFEGAIALKIALPPTLIRLQRREYYRMTTPLGTPVKVSINLPEALGGGTLAFPLADISCGGIALFDSLFQLGECVGTSFPDCRINLPGDAGVVTTTLQVRSLQDMTLLNSNKVKRRIGCQFIGISRANLAAVQRYITKLEREYNAREAGLD